MKSFKGILIALTLVFCLGFVVHFIKYAEFSFVALKCEQKLFLIGEGKVEINYYRLTKNILDDKPTRIYSSNPNFDEPKISLFFLACHLIQPLVIQ